MRSGVVVGTHGRARVEPVRTTFGIAVCRELPCRRCRASAAVTPPSISGDSSRACIPPVERLLRGKRLALVFGVGTYRHLLPLPSARKDAAAMAELLRSWGYTLITGGPVLDPTKADMQAAVDELRAAIEDGCTSVVYFTGHGVQGFLRPVDAQLYDRTCGVPA
jgi:hypothetical protein